MSFAEVISVVMGDYVRLCEENGRLRVELAAAIAQRAGSVPQCAGPPFEYDPAAHRVIAARDWRDGLEYAYYVGGEGAPASLDELHNPIAWSAGLPAWADDNRLLVVRGAPGRERIEIGADGWHGLTAADGETYERDPEPTAPSPLPAGVGGVGFTAARHVEQHRWPAVTEEATR